MALTCACLNDGDHDNSSGLGSDNASGHGEDGKSDISVGEDDHCGHTLLSNDTGGLASRTRSNAGGPHKQPAASSTPLRPAALERWHRSIEYTSLCGYAVLLIFSEIVHPLAIGAWERGPGGGQEWVQSMPFLPLLLTSVYCGAWLCYCWALCLGIMLQT